MESEVSKGSTFSLTIPLTSSQEEPVLFEPDAISLSKVADERSFVNPDQKPTILMAEDNEDMAAYVSGLLKSD